MTKKVEKDGCVLSPFLLPVLFNTFLGGGEIKLAVSFYLEVKLLRNMVGSGDMDSFRLLKKEIFMCDWIRLFLHTFTHIYFAILHLFALKCTLENVSKMSELCSCNAESDAQI